MHQGHPALQPDRQSSGAGRAVEVEGRFVGPGHEFRHSTVNDKSADIETKKKALGRCIPKVEAHLRASEGRLTAMGGTKVQVETPAAGGASAHRQHLQRRRLTLMRRLRRGWKPTPMTRALRRCGKNWRADNGWVRPGRLPCGSAAPAAAAAPAFDPDAFLKGAAPAAPETPSREKELRASMARRSLSLASLVMASGSKTARRWEYRGLSVVRAWRRRSFRSGYNSWRALARRCRCRRGLLQEGRGKHRPASAALPPMSREPWWRRLWVNSRWLAGLQLLAAENCWGGSSRRARRRVRSKALPGTPRTWKRGERRRYRRWRRRGQSAAVGGAAKLIPGYERGAGSGSQG